MPSDSEILGWGQPAIEHFAERETAEEIAHVVQRLVEIGGEQALRALSDFLGARGSDLEEKPMPSQLALRGLILCGPEGIDALATALRTRRVRYAAKVLVVLIRVAEGKGLTDPMGSARLIPDTFLDLPLPAGTEDATQRALSNIASEAVSDVPGALRLLASVFWESTLVQPEEGIEDASAIIRLLSESSIRLTPSLLDEFQELIGEQQTEGHYQRFLEQHPVLLDPLAADVVPHQRLGVEYATDFALRRHDGGWTLIEIERPQDDLFTSGNDFTHRFTHAFGQVLDFQHWVDHNIAYARELMPGITAPRGLLVLGTREGMSERQYNKLRQFAENSRRIEIVTYDELLARGRQLYESLWHRSPPRQTEE